MWVVNLVVSCWFCSGCLWVVMLLEDLVDVQLCKDFELFMDGFDFLLIFWQEVLGLEIGVIEIGDEEVECLVIVSYYWREGIVGGFVVVCICFELYILMDGEDFWELCFGLQVEVDFSLKFLVVVVWVFGVEML